MFNACKQLSKLDSSLFVECSCAYIVGEHATAPEAHHASFVAIVVVLIAEPSSRNSMCQAHQGR